MPPPVSSTRAAPLAKPSVGSPSTQDRPASVAAEQPAAKKAGWAPGSTKPPAAQTAPARAPATTKPGAAPEAIPADQRRDLSSFEARRRLATEASQVNPISADPALDNADRICGGAAAVNALLLKSTTPEAAKQNAEALRSAMGAEGVALPPSLDRKAVNVALDHLAAGSPSMDDVFVLQQVAYAVGRRFNPTGPNTGLNPAELGGLVADLKARGATLDPTTRFVQSKQHWTVSVGGVTANSDTSVKLDPASRAPANKGWGGDVVIRPDGVIEARTPTLNDPETKKALSPAEYCAKYQLPAPKNDGLRRGWAFELVPAASTKELMTLGDHRAQLLRAWAAMAAGQKPPTVLRE